MKTPRFLQDLISSPAYGNKNSDEYAQATKYMKLLYPGTVQFDATGKMILPAYDMTLKQFEEAQAKIDSDFEDAKQEATEEVLEEYGEYFDNLGLDFNIDDYVIQDEIIPVKVLFYGNIILDKKLLLYDLKVPEFKKQSKIWRWHSEQEENTCDECASRDGEIFLFEEDIPEIPVHPNCRCSITEDLIDEDGKTISSKPYKQKTQEPDKTPDNSPHDPTFKKPVNTEPGMYAKFDGKALTIYKNGQELYKFDAVSGKNGFQTPEYQDKKDTGPIPEGVYVARQSELQFYKNIDWFDRQKSALGRGTWRGGTDSWGNSRIWLEPAKETNTYGRGGFSIHGGTEPGSIGCIDLTSQMDDFTKWFESTGKDLILKVEY